MRGRVRGAWHRPRPRRLQAAAGVRRGSQVSRVPAAARGGRQHASVRALAPDSRLPTQIRASGLNPRTGTRRGQSPELRRRSPYLLASFHWASQRACAVPLLQTGGVSPPLALPADGHHALTPGYILPLPVGPLTLHFLGGSSLLQEIQCQCQLSEGPNPHRWLLLEGLWDDKGPRRVWNAEHTVNAGTLFPVMPSWPELFLGCQNLKSGLTLLARSQGNLPNW